MKEKTWLHAMQDAKASMLYASRVAKQIAASLSYTMPRDCAPICSLSDISKMLHDDAEMLDDSIGVCLQRELNNAQEASANMLSAILAGVIRSPES